MGKLDKLQSEPGTGPTVGRQRDNIGAHRASTAGMRQMTSGSSTPLTFRSVQLPMTCPPRHSTRGRLRNYGENRRGAQARQPGRLCSQPGSWAAFPDHLTIAPGVPAAGADLLQCQVGGVGRVGPGSLTALPPASNLSSARHSGLKPVAQL
jgi:hypothetical protein